MKQDFFFENSCLFSDLVLFAILCYIAVLGTATMAGQIVVGIGIGLTAIGFLALSVKRMNLIDHNSRISHMHA